MSLYSSLKITLAAICGSFALLGTHVLLASKPESVLLGFAERHDFDYVEFTFIFGVAAMVPLAVALREQRPTKSADAANSPN
jgi:hypothetical protein